MSNNEVSPSSKAFNRISQAILFFVVAAASVNGFLDGMLAGNPDARDSLVRSLDGTADRPFVYRQLVPMTANWLDRQFPEPVKDEIFNARNRAGLLIRDRITSSKIGQDRVYFLRYWFVCCAEFVSALFSLFLAHLLCKQIGFSPPAAALSAISFVLIVPILFAHYYDFPELLFLLLAAWLALRVHWIWLLPVSALATWNKESFLLFIPALYPLLRAKADRKTALLATTLVALPSIAVNLVLRREFDQNAGTPMEFHLWGQFRGFIRLLELAPNPFVRVYGAWGPFPYHLFFIGLLVWAFWQSWQRIPPYIKRHALIAAMINIPFYLVFGMSGELRDLSLLYVTFLVLIAESVAGWMGEDQRSSFVKPSVVRTHQEHLIEK